MAIAKWSANTLYQPGAFVLPKSGAAVFTPAPDNPSFETGIDGLTDWAVSYINGSAGPGVVATSDQAFNGTQSIYWAGNSGTGFKSSVTAQLLNAFEAPVTPGQKITATGYLWRNTSPSASSACDGSVGILWSNSSHAQIGGLSLSAQPGGTSGGGWSKRTVTAVAPVGAAFAQFVIQLVGNTSGAKIYVDAVSWDYSHQGVLPGFVFVAVQAAAGLSGKSEPTWPDALGYTVVDNAVTWEAEDASRVIWTAEPILKSGASEPSFPTVVGAHVVDNPGVSAISWVTTDGRITDPNCPQTHEVAIAASKIFAADTDVVRFSATTNPLDWSTQFDAGFLPFGLQTYGNEPVAALGLYHSNLIVFNGVGYQMWQVDADPANMALLDASPVGCTYHKSVQPVNNDLVFLTPVGIRSMGIAGASLNLQAGSFGKQVDPLVKQLIALGYEPMALFFPGTGQYWLIFGANAVVLTMNGGAADMSWSRYLFPATITNWTVLDGVLFLRAGDLVWQVDDNTLIDDAHSGTGTPFQGYMSWAYLDFGNIGLEKQLEGFSLVCTGECTITVGYNQANFALATAPYTVLGDTLADIGMIPLPISAKSFQFRLDFGHSQDWEWNATVVYNNTEGQP